MKQFVYPSNRRVDYERYELNKKIKKITANLNEDTITLVNDLSYLPFGRPSGMSTASGGNITNEHSDCDCLEIANPNSPMEQTYTYYDDRNLKSIRGTNTPWVNQDFEYDELGRLKNATGVYGSISYSYDKVGNRLTRNVDGQTESYSYYPGTNRLQSVTGTETVDYTYDDYGNPTTIGSRTYEYNLNGRLAKVKEGENIIAGYTYNGLGQRVKKVVGDTETIFHYDFQGNIISESLKEDNSYSFYADYVYMGSNRLAKIKFEPVEEYYYLNNYLGTPVLMTDNDGVISWEAHYKPFGEVDINPNVEVINNFRFAGQYYDEETGLHYNYHRYFDPKTGRFMTPDPIGQLGGINLYAYVLNNPINAVDPYGLKNWGQIIGGGILVIKGRTIVGVGVVVIVIGAVKAAVGDEIAFAPHTMGVGGTLVGAGIWTGLKGVELIIEGWNEPVNPCEDGRPHVIPYPIPTRPREPTDTIP